MTRPSALLLFVLAGCSSATTSPAAPSDSATAGDTSGDTGAGEDGAIDAPPPRCTTDRTGDDRPDDVDGYQIRVMYVLPSDGIDEEHDRNGRIERSVAGWNGWLAKQTGGPKMRLDTCDGKLDIGFQRLTKTDAAVKATGPYVREAIQRELPKRAKKIFAVYYGGGSTYACGGGAWPPELVGHVAAMYLHGTPPGPRTCDVHEVGRADGLLGYFEFGILHETFHTLGGAPTCAPHQLESGHVSEDPKDLMYRGPLDWAPEILDVGRDDYFGHGRADCLDIQKSVFLDPLPVDAKLPPGW